jgi:DNA-binding CsgD family transcriptional regulator
MPPSIRYATTEDGARIAFATIGEGPPLLCMPPVPFSHIEAGWRLEGQRRWYEGLGRHLQVALYDGRGTGLSDRDHADFSLEAMTRDLEAVAARLGWERFALCGLFNAAPAAIAFAAKRPEVVTDLILWGGFAKGADVYPLPLPAATPEMVSMYWPVLVETAARTWTSGDGSTAVAAYFRECVEPEAALHAFAAARACDVEALLPRVQARTLVMHRPHARGQRADLAQSLASKLPNAELALLEGDAPSPFDGDIEASVATIERFLGVASELGTPPSTPPAPAEPLTPRELEVLRLLARGMANKEIAQALDLSIHTVERHLTNLYPKIGCRSRTEATAYAITHGYV